MGLLEFLAPWVFWRIFLDGVQFWLILRTCFFFFTEVS